MMTVERVPEIDCPTAVPGEVSASVPEQVAAVEALGDRIVALAGQISAATCRWLLLVAEFDEQEGWARFGVGSCASWLAYACGQAKRTAVEHVRVARALAAHPSLAAGMASGRLSFSHVRAISRIEFEPDEPLLAELIMIAEHGRVSHLEAVVRGLRTVQDNDARAAGDGGGADPVEQVSSRWDDDGRWRLAGQLSAERGALIDGVLDRVMAARGLSRPDALVAVAETALAALFDAPDTPARELRGDERAAFVIHLDAAQLPAEHPEADRTSARQDARSAERARPVARPGSRPGARPGSRRRPYGRIADGPGLPDAVIARLACSGRVRTFTWAPDSYGRRQPLDVGRSQRVVTDRQFRALMVRDLGTCTHPGCESTYGLEAHHVRHWLHGGKTNMANLLLLCAHHHRAHHDGEFTIRATGGYFEFHRADGTLLPYRIDMSAATLTVPTVESAHSDIAPDAARTRWTGQRLDLGYAVSVLVGLRSSSARED